MSAQEARIRYLTHASMLVNVEAPSTSAHLSLNAIQLVEISGYTLLPELPVSRCQACGSLDVEHRTRSRFHSSAPKLVQHSLLKTKTREKELVRICRQCSRRLITPFLGLQTSQPGANKNISATTDRAASAIPISSSPVIKALATSEIKPSGKRRAKARRDNAGLQALLSKNKKADKAPASFDLMDFMK